MNFFNLNNFKINVRFYQNPFQFSNFTFVHFNSLTFKFIQLRLFHELLLYVVVNFLIL